MVGFWARCLDLGFRVLGLGCNGCSLLGRSGHLRPGNPKQEEKNCIPTPKPKTLKVGFNARKERRRMGVSENRGYLILGPYNKDPTI